jgi:cytochrome P450
LRAQTESGEHMTDQQARDEAITMLLAGHETTALALTYAIYALSRAPACRALLRAELAQFDGETPRFSDLPRLPYLDAVVKETLRLYPPAWAFGRQATSSFQLGGYELPAGAEIICGSYALHRDPRFFPEPNHFRPERWLDADQQPPRYAYVPFGAGPRFCIGSHFAKMETALCLAAILQQVELDVVPGYRLELLPVITMRPKGGMPVWVRRLRPAKLPTSPYSASLAPPLVA